MSNDYYDPEPEIHHYEYGTKTRTRFERNAGAFANALLTLLFVVIMLLGLASVTLDNIARGIQTTNRQTCISLVNYRGCHNTQSPHTTTTNTSTDHFNHENTTTTCIGNCP